MDSENEELTDKAIGKATYMERVAIVQHLLDEKFMNNLEEFEANRFNNFD